MGINRNLPNILSFSRIAIGLIIFLLLKETTLFSTTIAVVLLIVGLLTDYYDGKLARKNNTVTLFGKWVDPFCDFALFFFIYLSFYTLELMPVALFIIFLARELSMYLVIRPLSMVKKLDPGAKMPGKVKTAMQITGSLLILAMLIANQSGLISYHLVDSISKYILILLVTLSVVSLYWYIKPLILNSQAELRRQDQLTKVILNLVISFLLFHLLFGSTIALVFDIDFHLTALFLLSVILYHIFLVWGLNQLKGAFFHEETKAVLTKINLPSLLSFLRLSSLPTVLFLLLNLEKIPALTIVLPVLVCIFLTDLFDGFLARRLHQTTRIGRYIDSSSDYVNILGISFIYYFYHLIPTWFFILIIGRLVIQGAGMITFHFKKAYNNMIVTRPGKAAVFATMTLYALEMMELLNIPVIGNTLMVSVLEYVTGLLVAVSAIEKFIFLKGAFQSIRREEK
jgi:CDP-diacylglycerol--glycerol-3-phosphate 3-phosphatidyltransferase